MISSVKIETVTNLNKTRIDLKRDIKINQLRLSNCYVFITCTFLHNKCSQLRTRRLRCKKISFSFTHLESNPVKCKTKIQNFVSLSKSLVSFTPFFFIYWLQCNQKNIGFSIKRQHYSSN